MEISYQDINRKTIDRWVDDGWEWGKPISREVYAAAKNGQWDVKLTPVKFVPHDWFGDLKDRRVLGLAAGGGQQMPAAGGQIHRARLLGKAAGVGAHSRTAREL